MTADFLAVLDACVLVQAPLRDTLLRLAGPRGCMCRNGLMKFMAETVRTLENQIGLSAQKTAYLVGQLREHFGDAWVPGYEPLVERMTNIPRIVMCWPQR